MQNGGKGATARPFGKKETYNAFILAPPCLLPPLSSGLKKERNTYSNSLSQRGCKSVHQGPLVLKPWGNEDCVYRSIMKKTSLKTLYIVRRRGRRLVPMTTLSKVQAAAERGERERERKELDAAVVSTPSACSNSFPKEKTPGF